jgi:hypothetical protein
MMNCVLFYAHLQCNLMKYFMGVKAFKTKVSCTIHVLNKLCCFQNNETKGIITLRYFIFRESLHPP